MGQKRKWRWVEALPPSTCLCFKDQKGAWDVIEDEDDVATDQSAAITRRSGSSNEVETNCVFVNFHDEGRSMKLKQASLNCVDLQLTEADRNILKKMDSRRHKDRSNNKYSTMCRVRRKMRPIYKMVHDDASILDVHYAGQSWCLLSTISDWDFNVFTLDKLTNGRPLFQAGIRMLQDNGLIDAFKLDVVKLMRCISLLEEGYHCSNPYHNAVHAVDVAQAMHCYINEHKVSQHMTPLEKIIAIFSALAHDVEHPGVSNAFLIATSNHLAALYNNVSVLENHHWRTTMSMFHESGVFDHLDKSTLDAIEWQMKSLILATDITRQAEFLTKFKGLLDKDDLNMESKDDRHFMLQIALKCADISNPTRPWEVSRKWSELVCDEFFKQGDYERKLGLPVSNLNDKYSTTVAKIQSGFMQFVVLPLFNEWKRFNPTDLSDTMLQNMKANKTEWDAIICEAKEAQESQERSEQRTIPEENEIEEDVAEAELSCSPSIDIAPTIDEERIKQNEYLKICRQQRRSVPHSSDGENSDKEESGEDEDTDSKQSEDILDSIVSFGVSFMPRRHSLPISSLDPDSVSRPDSFASYHSPSQFSIRAQRRHSLPISAIPSAGMDIFSQLSDQLDTVAECSFNEEGEHYGEKISLQSLNPGALPEANREANKLTSAHGLDIFSDTPLWKYEYGSSQFSDIAQSSQHQSHKYNSFDTATSKITNNKNWTVLNIDQQKVQRLLGNPQHSVLIGRERRAVSIPTHFRLKSVLGLDSGIMSRRVSMGDQPIYLDTTPLLTSPVSGEDFLYQSDD